MVVTLGIYYLTPWIRWDRGPHAPDQAVLLDLAARRFYFFFIEIWPQEFYLRGRAADHGGLRPVPGHLTVGRAWCGYTCPQTVWVDLFLVVERCDRRRPQRPHEARRRRRGPPTRSCKRVAKHAIWLLIAIATGGAWIFYFADAPALLADLVHRQGGAGRLYHRRES